MSEIYIKNFPIDSLKDVKIEFGQNIRQENITIRPDACMFESEIPILLARVAKYNYDKLANAKQNSANNDRIDLTKSITHLYSEDINSTTSISDGTLIFSETGKIPAASNSVGDENNSIKRYEINITELQEFIEKATIKKRDMLTIRETLEAMKNGKRKNEKENPLSDLITSEMITRADTKPIVILPSAISTNSKKEIVEQSK